VTRFVIACGCLTAVAAPLMARPQGALVSWWRAKLTPAGLLTPSGQPPTLQAAGGGTVPGLEMRWTDQRDPVPAFQIAALHSPPRAVGNGATTQTAEAISIAGLPLRLKPQPAREPVMDSRLGMSADDTSAPEPPISVSAPPIGVDFSPHVTRGMECWANGEVELRLGDENKPAALDLLRR
jgi:hypothetical protein